MAGFFYCELDNFGDAVNPVLVERLFDFKAPWASKKRATLCGMGSVLSNFARPARKFSAHFYRALCPPIHVWTSGFIKEVPADHRFIRKMRFHALRGEHTRGAVEKLLGEKIDLPLGDGGLLLARLLDKVPDKKFSLGIIPHVVDFADPVFTRIHAAHPDATMIDLRGDPLVALNKIAACECVISSAMHGLIAADSLGIPNRWLEVSDRVDGQGYKFRDYYSVFGLNPTALTQADPIVFSRELANYITEDYSIDQREVKKIQEQLIAAFPRF